MVGYSASVAINDHGRAIDLADLLIERTDLAPLCVNRLGVVGF